jgi:tRNA G18 (ribose-2'-O)-methylase SpoU
MRKIRNDELGRKHPEEFRKAIKRPVIAVLDNVRSLNNVGSVFRSADAFLCEAVYLCGITGTPPHREIHKTALGAEETVEWRYFEDTTAAVISLKESGYRIIAVEQAENCVALDRFDFHTGEKTAFVFGHEVDGVSDSVLDLLDEALEIPQFGSKHSINISVCAGIVLWEHFRKCGA